MPKAEREGGKHRFRTAEEIAVHNDQEGYQGHARFYDRLPFLHPSEGTTDPARAAAFVATIICSSSAVWMVVEMVRYSNHFSSNDKGKMFNLEQNLSNPKIGGAATTAGMSLFVTTFWFSQALILWVHEWSKKRNFNLLDHVRRKVVSKAQILDMGVSQRDEEDYNHRQYIKQARAQRRRELEMEGLEAEDGILSTSMGGGGSNAIVTGHSAPQRPSQPAYGNPTREKVGAVHGGNQSVYSSHRTPAPRGGPSAVNIGRGGPSRYH